MSTTMQTQKKAPTRGKKRTTRKPKAAERKATAAETPTPGLQTFRLGIVTTPKGRRAWEPVRTDGTLAPSLRKIYADGKVEKWAEVRAASFADARKALEQGKGKWSAPSGKSGRASKRSSKGRGRSRGSAKKGTEAGEAGS